MITKTVAVTSYVKVTLDETKFTPEWMAEFRRGFYDFDTLGDHIEHLAQLTAREIVDENYDYDKLGITPHPFVEGYGPLNEMGILLEIKYIETETMLK